MARHLAHAGLSNAEALAAATSSSNGGGAAGAKTARELGTHALHHYLGATFNHRGKSSADLDLAARGHQRSLARSGYAKGRRRGEPCATLFILAARRQAAAHGSVVQLQLG